MLDKILSSVIVWSLIAALLTAGDPFCRLAAADTSSVGADKLSPKSSFSDFLEKIRKDSGPDREANISQKLMIVDLMLAEAASVIYKGPDAVIDALKRYPEKKGSALSKNDIEIMPGSLRSLEAVSAPVHSLEAKIFGQRVQLWFWSPKVTPAIFLDSIGVDPEHRTRGYWANAMPAQEGLAEVLKDLIVANEDISSTIAKSAEYSESTQAEILKKILGLCSPLVWYPAMAISYIASLIIPLPILIWYHGYLMRSGQPDFMATMVCIGGYPLVALILSCFFTIVNAGIAIAVVIAVNMFIYWTDMGIQRLLHFVFVRPVLYWQMTSNNRAIRRVLMDMELDRSRPLTSQIPWPLLQRIPPEILSSLPVSYRLDEGINALLDVATAQ